MAIEAFSPEAKQRRSAVSHLPASPKDWGYRGRHTGERHSAMEKPAEPVDYADLRAASREMEAAQAPESAHAGVASAAVQTILQAGEENAALKNTDHALKTEIQFVKNALKGHQGMVQAALEDSGEAEEAECANTPHYDELEALKLPQGTMLELLDSLSI
jgi:hypothetical protein